MLSGHLRVPVVTTPRPQLTAAIGGALRAARGPGDTGATISTPAAAAVAAPAAEQPETGPGITPWYRLPAVVLIGAVVALLLAGAAVALGLRPDTNPGPAVTNSPAPPVNAPSSVRPAP